MNFIDLSHFISPKMSVYPGDDLPEIEITRRIELDDYRQTSLFISSHTGTHVDAPAHILKEGKYLSNFPLNYFVGEAVIIIIPYMIDVITKEFLQAFEKELQEAQFVLLNTGWGQNWGTNKYYKNFPVLENDAAEYLTEFTITGVGMDTPSADPVNSADLKNHKILLGNEIILIENLYFPEDMEELQGEFFCFPLPYPNADGSPVRAVLKIN